MNNFTTRTVLFIAFLLGFATNALANDSDVVNCNHSWKIVVLGSSSSYGYGASVPDSAWVSKFTAYIKRKNAQSEVYNLGIPGFTTYKNLCPTGFVPPANRPDPDNSFNITAALALHPDAIIINATNDAANDYTVAEQQANYERTMHFADSANIPVWVTTTQPRNNMTAAQINNLTTMRDWTYTRFGDKAVDFWTGIANPDGSIATYYDYDYAHVNDHGHDLFYTRMKAETILDSLCIRITQTLIARAGNDIALTLPVSTAVLDGSTSYSSNGGTITGYQWVQLSGAATQIVSSGNATTAISNLSEGRYSFSLTVTDNASNVKSDTVNVVVSSRILIDFGPGLTASPDANGNYWNNITETQVGIKTKNTVTVSNVPTGIGLEVVNRIDGTFNVSGPGTNTGNSIGTVGDYPASATTDFSFAEPSATNGRWKITGLDPTKQYTIKFWGTRSVTDDRIIQIKRADQTLWLEYNAAGNSNYSTSASFTFSHKTEMNFDIRVKSGSAFGYICLIDISRTTPVASLNIPPTAIANGVVVSLPASSGILDGSNSNDEDGNIVRYEWVQTAGPSVAQIVSPLNPITIVNNLVEGYYTFRLTVMDDSSAIGTINTRLTVNTRILFDVGPDITTGPDAGGKYWNNITNGINGVKIQHAVTTGNASTSVNFEVVNRIDGTFNVSGPGTNAGNTIGDVGEYPASATTDFAFVHPSATNGQWKLTGLDSTKYYSIKFWGTRNASDERITKIKRFDETNFQQYNAANNADYNNAAVFNLTGKTAMAFDISVDGNSPFGYISVVDIIVSSQPLNCNPAVTINTDQSFPACSGTTIEFSADATGTGSIPSYQWKKNGVDINGATNRIYSSSTLNNNDVISCAITANTNCGFGLTATSNSITAQLFPVPSPGNISGPISACPYLGTSTQATYSIAPVANTNSYLWTLPVNVSLVSGQGTTSINVTFAGNYTTSVIRVKAISNCAISNESILTVDATSTPTPGAISGPVGACEYIGSSNLATYTINKVPGALAYIWAAPAGASISSHPGGTGINDTIIKVSFSNNFVAGSVISVKVSGCAPGLPGTLAIFRPVPATPAPISIDVYPCKYLSLIPSSGSFSIRKVSGATSYSWVVPAGSGVSHINGTGINDTAVTVTFPLGFNSGNISVTALNACGSNNTASTVSITAIIPANLSLSLSGPTNACPYLGTNTSAIYTTNKIEGVTSYTWTVPAGAVAIHPNGAGINDTVIAVTYAGSFNSGSISVKANTACGSSAVKTLSIGRNLPATPGSITSKLVSSCPTVYTYSIAAIPANATSVFWTVPAGATITSGQGSTSITVTYHSLVLLSNVSAAGVNNCGTGTSSKLTILNLSVCLGGRGTNAQLPKAAIKKELMPDGLEVITASNPSYSDFKLTIRSNDKNEPVFVRVIDISGKIIETRQNISSNGYITIGGGYKTGIYICEFTQAGKKNIIKLVKL